VATCHRASSSLHAQLDELAGVVSFYTPPERTLQRRLAEKGLSHSTFVDNVRRELAPHYLTETTLTVYAIAERLQFANATAFHRAFRRWTEASPAKYRRRQRLGSHWGSESPLPRPLLPRPHNLAN
jgi:AraC-like DNA-binding protein